MTLPYGMIQRGAFYRPPGAYGGYGGGTQDPIAALVGNALGTYTSQTEKAQADALAAKQEQDTANWRNFTGKLAAYKEGLTTEAPTAANVPVGTTGGAPTSVPSGTGPGAMLQPSSIAPLRPTDVVTAQPTPQALLTDPTGQAWYRNLQTPTKYIPEHGRSGELVAFDPRTGTAKPSGADLGAMPDKLDPWGPEAIAARIKIAQAGASARAEAKPPSDIERRSAASAGDMVGGARLMRDILSRNPGAASGAYNKLLLLAKYPAAGSIGLDAARRLGIISEPTDDERNFMTGAEQYMNGKLGLTSGSRITENQYRLHLAPIIPSASETPGSLQAKAKLIDQSVRARITQTKKAFPEQFQVLEPESQGYLRTMGYDPTRGDFGGSPTPSPTPAPTPAAPRSATAPLFGPPKGLSKFLTP